MPPLRPVTSQVAAEIGYDPAGGTDPGPFTQQVAERLHAADPRWGRRINSTGPISDDTVAYRVGTSPVNPLSIDIVLAAHTTHARLQWHTYDHWAETPGAHPTISRHISVYPGISRILFFCSRAPRRRRSCRTHLAHTAEHAVDLETGAVVGVTVQDADAGDTTTMVETLITAAEQVEAVLPAAAGITEVVGDKGYHSNDTMVAFADLGIRSYVSEPDRGRRNWKGKAAAREAVYANRRRIRGPRGQRLLRQRGERLERPNAHLYETGRMRRVHLRGHPNILKRVLVHICGFNLGLLMRQLTGVGTPRSLQGRAAAAVDALMASLSHLWTLVSPSWARDALDQPDSSRVDLVTGWHKHMPIDLRIRSSTTGC